MVEESAEARAGAIFDEKSYGARSALGRFTID
jgi:hypothetical protein